MIVPGLDVHNVSFRYSRSSQFVFRDVTFAANPGEAVGVVGRNGVGKTTLIRVVGGLYAPNSGHVTLDGDAVSRLPSRVAFIEAEFDMFPYLTIEENVRFFLDFYGADYGVQDLERMLARYRLTRERRRVAQAASRGTRKKTQIVTALLQRPRLLLADEPFDGLDVDAQDAFIEDLARFQADEGIALISLHDEERERALTTSRVVLISPEAVLAKP